MTFAGVLRRVWTPRVRADVGSQMHPCNATSKSSDTRRLNPKSVVDEAFRPVGTVADISYFDVNSDPRRVDGARLPWSLEITASVPAIAGNVVARGDGNSVGCRIVVHDQVKAERITNEVDAYTHCLVKGA